VSDHWVPVIGFRRCHGAVPILSNFSGAIFRQSRQQNT
jgi:hypothetical protein